VSDAFAATVEELQRQREDTVRSAQGSFNINMDRMKKKYDKKNRAGSFEVGDLAALKVNHCEHIE